MANSDINNGARIMAALNLDGGQEARLRSAARAMGMSEQEAARTIARATRKIERSGKSNTPIDQVIDEFMRRGAAVGTVNQEMPADIDDYRTIPNTQLESGEFGNQDEIQNFGGVGDQGRIKNAEQAQREIEKARGKRDSNLLSRTYFEKGKEGPQREEVYVADGERVPERFVESAKSRDFGIYREDVAAPAAQVQRIERDALQQGVDQYGADAFPGAVDVIGRIDDDIRGNREGERSLVREMVGQGVQGLPAEEIRRRATRQLNQEFSGNDTPNSPIRSMPVDAYAGREEQILGELGRIRQNAAAVEANNWRAQAEANVLGQDFTVGGRGAAADQAVENLGQIAELGPAKVGYDFRVSQNPVDRGTSIPDSLPLNLPDQYNAPATDNRFAGPLQRQEQWMVDSLRSLPTPNTAGGYGDVGINEQLGIAREAIQRAQINGQSVDLGDTQIRSVGDLQAAADQVIALGRQNNVSFFNNVDGKNVHNPNPGIGEVLERGGLNARQVGDVAKATFAVEAAMKNPINQVAKNFYGVGMGQPARDIEFGGYHPDLGAGDVKIDMLGREKVEGKEVKSQLQKISGYGRPGKGEPDVPLNSQELADARMPFQAGVADEGVKRARFVRSPVMGPGPTRQMSTDQVYERFGPINGQIANEVIQRFEQTQGSNPDGFGARVERQRNMDPGPGVDSGPDPYQAVPATGGGFTEQTQKRVPSSMLNTLAELNSGPTQGPRTPGVRQKIMNSIKRAPTNFVQAPRYQRRGAVVGGALLGAAGISDLIGGERDRRQQEGQY